MAQSETYFGDSKWRECFVVARGPNVSWRAEVEGETRKFSIDMAKTEDTLLKVASNPRVFELAQERDGVRTSVVRFKTRDDLESPFVAWMSAMGEFVVASSIPSENRSEEAIEKICERDIFGASESSTTISTIDFLKGCNAKRPSLQEIYSNNMSERKRKVSGHSEDASARPLTPNADEWNSLKPIGGPLRQDRKVSFQPVFKDMGGSLHALPVAKFRTPVRRRSREYPDTRTPLLRGVDKRERTERLRDDPFDLSRSDVSSSSSFFAVEDRAEDDSKENEEKENTGNIVTRKEHDGHLALSDPVELSVREESIRVGVHVLLRNGKRGTVRFAGQTHFHSGNWVGIELLHPEGKNSGLVDNTRYFNCIGNEGLSIELKYGTFVRADSVVRVLENTHPADEAETCFTPKICDTRVFTPANGRT